MTPALYLTTLLAGLVLGWHGSRSAAAWSATRRAGQPRRNVVQPSVAPGLEIDLTDPTRPYDWRRDAPDIASCRACHGRGRIWTIDGYGHRCPCGAPVAHHRQAAGR